MARDCWCKRRFHLPGEYKRHQTAHQEIKDLLRHLEDRRKDAKVEDIVQAEFNERNLWVLIESLPESETELNNYLRGLADTFRKTPKMYGRGLKRRENDV